MAVGGQELTVGGGGIGEERRRVSLRAALSGGVTMALLVCAAMSGMLSSQSEGGVGGRHGPGLSSNAAGSSGREGSISSIRRLEDKFLTSAWRDSANWGQKEYPQEQHMSMTQTLRSRSRSRSSGAAEDEDEHGSEPVVLNVQPESADTGGRVTVTIRGKNLGDHRHKKVKVMLGQYECQYARWRTPEQISCVVSAGFGQNNTVDVAIRDFKGEDWYHANLTDGFDYNPMTVTKVEPGALDVEQEYTVVVRGKNFAQRAGFTVEVLFNGVLAQESRLTSDSKFRFLITSPDHGGIFKAVAMFHGPRQEYQNISFNIPVKYPPIEGGDFRIKDIDTDSQAWKIAMAACMDECGLPASFFESASNLILSEEEVGWNVLKSGSSTNSQMTDVEAVCVQQMRRYLLEHFDAVGPKEQNIDGVVVFQEGNKLTGEPVHDKQVYEKQAQILEEETGESVSQLAAVTGDWIKEVPRCANYPECAVSDETGHLGWVWQWHYSVSKGWEYDYSPLVTNNAVPKACPFCNRDVLQGNHSEQEIKCREDYCVECSRDSFEKLQEEECKAFLHMCLVQVSPDDGSDFSASSAFMDPPEGSQAEEEWAAVECKVEEMINGTDVAVEVNETGVESAFPAPVHVGFGGGVVGRESKGGGGGDRDDILSRLRRMSFDKFPDDERRKHETLAEYGPEEYVTLSKFPSEGFEGSVGPRGDNIHNIGTIILGSFFIIISIGAFFYLFIFRYFGVGSHDFDTVELGRMTEPILNVNVPLLPAEPRQILEC